MGEYATVHITPESQYSYASFESNMPASSYLEIVTNILHTFNPGKFILTIFATKTSVAAPSHQELKRCSRFGDRWIRNDIQYCSFQVSCPGASLAVVSVQLLVAAQLNTRVCVCLSVHRVPYGNSSFH